MFSALTRAATGYAAWVGSCCLGLGAKGMPTVGQASSYRGRVVYCSGGEAVVQWVRGVVGFGEGMWLSGRRCRVRSEAEQVKGSE